MKYILIVFAIFALSCIGGQNKTDKVAHTFTVPAPPTMITNPEERLGYIVTNYWNSFDFADTTWIEDTAKLEQAFVDYIDMLSNLEPQRASGFMSGLAAKFAVDSTMFDRFCNMGEHYLYDPNSPMRNEELYIPILQCIIGDQRIDTLEKLRPANQLEMLMKNRKGEAAIDFYYTLPSGKRSKMSDVKSEYTILFFYNPDCTDCGRVKEFIRNSQTINSGLADGMIKILAVYPDEQESVWRENLSQMPARWIVGWDSKQQLRDGKLYDLRAIPNLYLLDRDKKVILKDARIEDIEWRLSN